MVEQLYHERQSRQLCALHVLNNLLQQPTFDKQDLDSICCQLAPDSFWWWNPHRSPLGLGNYDVNVILRALQLSGFETVWFDKRRDLSSCPVLKRAFGFILNVPVTWIISSILPSSLRSRHWIALRCFEGLGYVNLDSRLPKPIIIGQADEFMGFLTQELQKGGRELLIVTNADANSSS